MYATVDDLRRRWRSWPDGLDDSTAAAVLDDASVWLRAAYPAIPDSPSERLSGVLRVVAVGMAKRALQGDGHEGMASAMLTAGPFTRQDTYRNSDGALFLTAQERQMLDAALAGVVSSAGYVTAEGW